MELYAINKDGSVTGIESLRDDAAREVASSYPTYYEAIGYVEPWIGYLARRDEQWVGACGFKGAPKRGRVEIAYFTFPAFEGQGVATGMARALITKASEADSAVIVTARTLPEGGPSSTILRKLGFTKTTTVTDAEDGEVWEWVLEG